jgi:crotonobetainyl-CoA:carnitine CoA-transferase CaiB-like acyl-CoA transferase
MVALYDRLRTGQGQYIDTSLLEAGLALSVWEATQYFSGAGIPEPTGSAHRMGAPYQAFRCADGHITIGAWSDRLFARLCDVLGHPDWRDRPEFATSGNRVENRAALAGLIEEITVLQPRQHWLDLLDGHDIPCGPINSYAEALRSPQATARGMVQAVDHPALGRLEVLGSPLKLSASPPAIERPAPLLGEHTTQVLREAGYTDEAIARMREAGAIR